MYQSIRASKVFFKLIRTSKVRKIRTLKVRKIRTMKVRKIRTTKVVDQYVKNQNVKKIIKSKKSNINTLDVLIIQNAIGNIRTSKVAFVGNPFDVLILPMASEKIRLLKV